MDASSRSDPATLEAQPRHRIGGGLVARMTIASVVLALIVGAAFAVMLLAISDLRASSRLVNHSRGTTAASDRLEELVIDLETGVRGFVIARQERFLDPWRSALAAFPANAGTLERLAEGPEQKRRVRSIVRQTSSYIDDYAMPLVSAVRRNSPAARSIAASPSR
jgi:CHASE3 domain sensor protein